MPDIENRLRAIEDRLEIYNLIASHPPSADTGADYFTRAAYTEDGVIDLGGGKTADGNEAVAAMLKTPGHQAAIAGGLAHFCGLPRIEIDGDTATVTSYLQILTPHPTAEPHEVPNHGVEQGLSHPSRRRQPLGSGAHAVRLEDQAPHAAPARRLRAGARTAAPRACGPTKDERLALALAADAPGATDA